MDIPDALVKLIAENGITAPIAAVIFLGLYIHERRGRTADRKSYDEALAKLNEEHIETLKLITPLVQKFTETMAVITPIVMAQVSRRCE